MQVSYHASMLSTSLHPCMVRTCTACVNDMHFLQIVVCTAAQEMHIAHVRLADGCLLSSLSVCYTTSYGT